MIRDVTAKPVRLKDYRPPAFLVDEVQLTFHLDPMETQVQSQLTLRRNPALDHENFPLELNGEDLQLLSIKLDGKLLTDQQYRHEDDRLIVPQVPSQFILETEVLIHPRENTRLEGLYVSRDILCTQCEAEGFRRITFFPDRPDVMARYTVTLRADKKRYPVLLANGNLEEQGDLEDGRHYAVWRDPFPKPSYLFALVAGDLEKFTDTFTTRSGREVLLEIYVEPQDLDKCSHAMYSLKRAMAWDEFKYGREYDLDRYMIVAVSHFNMGAMENKGLNLFNTQYISARPETATDDDYEHILAVVGHEYFHNWTGNRITLRDWFQLSLKEGLTVFREQHFSADEGSPAVRRIEDVNLLRTRQFPEDESPLAHPVRPDSYLEINNFYTMTVYEKGAEVVRLLHTLLGEEGFRRGMDLYFERHDGQAVTCEDFVQAMADANQTDLTQFMLWYTQAGTPSVLVDLSYDAEGRTFTLRCRQSCPPTPGQPHKAPLPIPLRLGLLDPDGKEIPLQLAGEQAANGTCRVLVLNEPEQSFQFVNIPKPPVLSILRGFSAPVKLDMERPLEEWFFLWRHDSDAFNRWDAGQILAARLILQPGGQPQPAKDPRLVAGIQQLFQYPLEDLSYTALLLMLPEYDYLAEQMEIIDVDGIFQSRELTRQFIAQSLEKDFLACYQGHHCPEQAQRTDAHAIGQRRLKNACLSYLATLSTPAIQQLSLEQFHQARNMTDQLAALKAIVHHPHPEQTHCLEKFYRQWQEEALVIDKWFAIQASSPLPGALERVKALLAQRDFDLKNPNRVRAVLGVFSRQNPVHFHATDGSGYRLFTDYLLELDRINPQVAARLATPLASWQRYDPTRRQLMRAQLERIHQAPELSRDLFEIVDKALEG